MYQMFWKQNICFRLHIYIVKLFATSYFILNHLNVSGSLRKFKIKFSMIHIKSTQDFSTHQHKLLQGLNSQQKQCQIKPCIIYIVNVVTDCKVQLMGRKENANKISSDKNNFQYLYLLYDNCFSWTFTIIKYGLWFPIFLSWCTHIWGEFFTILS